MASRKRNLEKVEQRLANAPDAPDEPCGAAADYLRDLIAKAERGELPKVKPATDEKRPETWLEAEVKTIAERLRHQAAGNMGGETGTAASLHRIQPKAQTTGADDEPPQELLATLLRKLARDKVH